MVDFDKLAQQAFTEGATIEDKNRLWKAVFDLEEWYCVSQGEVNNPYPFATYLEEDKPVLLVFTDSNRVQDYATQHEIHSEMADLPMLSLPSASAIDYFIQFEQKGIWGVWFNAGTIGFYAPLQGLQTIHTHINNLETE